MKGKVICVLVMTLFIATGLNVIKAENNQKEDSLSESIFDDEFENCAGIIATGSVCKDGRSILWKTRHHSENDYYVQYVQGDPYDYINIRSGGAHTMCVNEQGLAVASFTGVGEMSEKYRTLSQYHDKSADSCRAYIMVNYNTVQEAANYIADHVSGNSGAHTAIISAEYGKGAVVSYDTIDGQQYSHIKWVNNDWNPIDNALHCEHDEGTWDDDDTGLVIKEIWENIETYGSSSDRNDKVTMEDVCHLGAKNVEFQEFGSKEFSTKPCVARADYAGSAYVVVSGEPFYNACLTVAWVQLGRSALVGTFLPVSAYFTNNDWELSDCLKRDGNDRGFERYMDAKVNYATDDAGYGNKIYIPDRVRQIQEYANMNEKTELFDHYQEIYDNKDSDPIWVLLGKLSNLFHEDNVLYLTSNYVFGQKIDPIIHLTPIKPEITGPGTVKAGVETYFWFQSDRHQTWPPEEKRNNQIFFMVDWGDGSEEKWYGPYPTDTLIPLSHTWTMKGNYDISVIARNRWGQESDPSDTKPIEVPRNRLQPNSSFLMRLFERFPNAFPIIRQLLGL